MRGYGGDAASTSVVLRDVRASRQPSNEIIRGRDEATDVEERSDADFYVDVPADPTAVRIGDRITWRRADASGRAFGPEFSGAEVRRVDLNDFPKARLSHLRIVTRGGDGTGA